MILTPARWLVLLGCVLTCQVYALAPVVDDSENFASYDDDGVSVSTDKARHAPKYANEDVPLVKSIPKDHTQNNSLQEQVRLLQQELQTVRGELEIQAHRIEQLQQNLKNERDALEARLHQDVSSIVTNSNKNNLHEVQKNVVNDTVGPTVKPTVKPMVTSPVSAYPSTSSANKNPADEQIAYLAAYDLVKSKRYDEALIAMQAFIQQYPRGGYTANAEYWTGELFLAKNQPDQAILHFDVVLKQFPTSSKAAASSLKIGYALISLGKKDEAKKRFQEVIQYYPDTAASQLAKSKLKGL